MSYNLTTPPEGFNWTGPLPIPAIGARVKVNFNSFGEGDVTGYFTEASYLGPHVHLDEQPKWHLKQNGIHPVILVFGPEISA